MPTYKVIAPGFYGGNYYDPEGKRKTLTTDKPFTKKNKMPSWLAVMPDESKVVKAKREAQEKSRNAATEFINGQIDETEKKINDLTGSLQAASTEKGRAKIQAELTEAEVELASLKTLIDSDEEEESTQEQVAKLSTEGDGADADFIGDANAGSKVETL